MRVFGIFYQVYSTKYRPFVFEPPAYTTTAVRTASWQGFDARGFVESKPRSRSDRYRGQDSSSSGGDIGQNRRLQEIDVKERQDAEVDGDGDSEGEYETAVHMRMFPVPKVAGW